MSQMLKSSGAMAGATLVSRVLGLAREVCYARFMGDGPVAGAFLLAFMIPNLFRRLLGEGALTQVFIPIFKAKEKAEGKVAMWRSANAVVSGLLVVSAVLVGLVGLVVSAVLAWGELAANTRLLLELLRWMFPYMGLVCVASVAMGMLNARGHFFVPALAPAILNVILIVAVLGFAPMIEGGTREKVFALAIAVLLAGVAQLLYQLPWLRREGFRWKWISPWRDESVRKVVRKLAPAAIGAAAFQINVLATQCLGFWSGEHVVASYTYAVRLMELPQGLFGVSMAVFLLPTLAGLAAEKKEGEFQATLSEGLGHVIFINSLMFVFLMVLPDAIARLLFERGAFTASSTEHVAFALRCLAPALVFYSIVGLLVRAFNARGDVKTPMKISLICLGVNLALAVVLMGQFPEELRQGAFGIANSISACLNCVLLAMALKRRGIELDLSVQHGPRSSWQLAGCTLLAAMATGGGLLAAYLWWGTIGLGARVGAVMLPMALGGVVYLGLGALLRVPTVRQIWGLLRGGRGKE